VCWQRLQQVYELRSSDGGKKSAETGRELRGYALEMEGRKGHEEQYEEDDFVTTKVAVYEIGVQMTRILRGQALRHL
jgi:hypothetical protein